MQFAHSQAALPLRHSQGLPPSLPPSLPLTTTTCLHALAGVWVGLEWTTQQTFSHAFHTLTWGASSVAVSAVVFLQGHFLCLALPPSYHALHAISALPFTYLYLHIPILHFRIPEANKCLYLPLPMSLSSLPLTAF